MPIEVEISDTQRHIMVERSAISELVRTILFTEQRTSATISIALVDNDTIHTINRTHLDHDWPTDVISFPLSDPGEAVLAGELVVSTEMAVSCAVERNVDPRDELALYIVHGMLHLCGYDDKSDADVRLMRSRENEVLRQAGLKNPFPSPGDDHTRDVGQPATELDHPAASGIVGEHGRLSPSDARHSELQPWSG